MEITIAIKIILIDQSKSSKGWPKRDTKKRTGVRKLVNKIYRKSYKTKASKFPNKKGLKVLAELLSKNDHTKAHRCEISKYWQ